jgi:hypothetical protein
MMEGYGIKTSVVNMITQVSTCYNRCGLTRLDGSKGDAVSARSWSLVVHAGRATNERPWCAI